MTEKEIESMRKILMKKLRKDDVFHGHNIIHYCGELDGFHYWYPDDWRYTLCEGNILIKVHPETMEYTWITGKEANMLDMVLWEKNPQYCNDEIMSEREAIKDAYADKKLRQSLRKWLDSTPDWEGYARDWLEAYANNAPLPPDPPDLFKHKKEDQEEEN